MAAFWSSIARLTSHTPCFHFFLRKTPVKLDFFCVNYLMIINFLLSLKTTFERLAKHLHVDWSHNSVSTLHLILICAIDRSRPPFDWFSLVLMGSRRLSRANQRGTCWPRSALNSLWSPLILTQLHTVTVRSIRMQNKNWNNICRNQIVKRKTKIENNR